WPSLRVEATAWTSRSRRMRYSSPRISTSYPASGAKRTRSPSSTLRTVGPTAMTSAQTSRRFTFAVAGIRIPAPDLRSPTWSDGRTRMRSAVMRIDCLTSEASMPTGPMAARLVLWSSGPPRWGGAARPGFVARKGVRLHSPGPPPRFMALTQERRVRGPAPLVRATGAPTTTPFGDRRLRRAHEAARDRAAARDHGPGDDPRRRRPAQPRPHRSGPRRRRAGRGRGQHRELLDRARPRPAHEADA